MWILIGLNLISTKQIGFQNQQSTNATVWIIIGLIGLNLRSIERIGIQQSAQAGTMLLNDLQSV